MSNRPNHRNRWDPGSLGNSGVPSQCIYWSDVLVPPDSTLRTRWPRLFGNRTTQSLGGTFWLYLRTEKKTCEVHWGKRIRSPQSLVGDKIRWYLRTCKHRHRTWIDWWFIPSPRSFLDRGYLRFPPTLLSFRKVSTKYIGERNETLRLFTPNTKNYTKNTL